MRRTRKGATVGQNIDQLLETARARGAGAKIDVTLVTNQDDGFVTYNIGTLAFHHGPAFAPIRAQTDSFATDANAPLTRYMSYERLSIDPPPPLPPAGSDPPFPPTPRQPFNANALEKVGLSLSHIKDITGATH